MAIADTDNPAYQRAFKTGYRFALAGKGPVHMPHDIRYDTQMREYFVQGWQTAQDEIAQQAELTNKPDWRYRIAWFLIMVLGGIATASVLLSKIQQEREPDSIAENRTVQPKQNLEQVTGLLSEQQRQDLAYQQQKQAELESLKTPLSPIVRDSGVQLISAQLHTNSENFTLSPLQKDRAESPTNVPKYLRKLAFHSKLRLNKSDTLFLVWRYNGLLIQKELFELDAGEQKIRSVQLMSSARQGKWYIEIWDQEQRVLQRMTFNYGNRQLNENH